MKNGEGKRNGAKIKKLIQMIQGIIYLVESRCGTHSKGTLLPSIEWYCISSSIFHSLLPLSSSFLLSNSPLRFRTRLECQFQPRDMRRGRSSLDACPRSSNEIFTWIASWEIFTEVLFRFYPSTNRIKYEFIIHSSDKTIPSLSQNRLLGRPFSASPSPSFSFPSYLFLSYYSFFPITFLFPVANWKGQHNSKGSRGRPSQPHT